MTRTANPKRATSGLAGPMTAPAQSDSVTASATPAAQAAHATPATGVSPHRRGGRNIVAGLRNLIGDLLAPPRVPTMVRPDAFEVGVDLAITPGAVVLRTDVFELIQYTPQIPTVRFGHCSLPTGRRSRNLLGWGSAGRPYRSG